MVSKNALLAMPHVQINEKYKRWSQDFCPYLWDPHALVGTFPKTFLKSLVSRHGFNLVKVTVESKLSRSTANFGDYTYISRIHLVVSLIQGKSSVQ